MSETVILPKKSAFSSASALRAVLLVSLGLVFALRVWGLNFGLPYEFHPDENKYVDKALRWHLEGDSLGGFVNPPLFTYFLVGANWMWLFFSPFRYSTDWITATYFFARLWSVVFGVLAVSLVFPIGKRAYNSLVGAVATVLLAALFLPGRGAHFAVNDTALAFFSLLTIYFSLRLYSNPHWTGYFLTGIAVGLATTAKLIGIVAIAVPLVAHLLKTFDLSPSFVAGLFSWTKHKYMLLCLLAVPITVIIVSPEIFLNFQGFV